MIHVTKLLPEFDWYVSGPMTGLPEYNFPEFHRVTALLESYGFTVSNPAAKGEISDWEWSDYLRWDLMELIRCRGVVLLDGWEGSKGAQLETHVAHALGMPILHYTEVLG